MSMTMTQKILAKHAGLDSVVAGQLIVEHVYNYVMPISVFISVGGGIYFLYLLLTKRRV